MQNTKSYFSKNIVYLAWTQSLLAMFGSLYFSEIKHFTPCTLAASCTVKYTGYFGFITIPFMSFASFTAITLCMVILKKYEKQ